MIGLLIASLFAINAYAGPAMERLEAFYANNNALTGRFTQTLIDEHGGVLEEYTGTLWLQRPGRFRWDYSKPYEQQLIADGEKLWLYDADLEQVTVRPMNDGLSVTPAALLTGIGLNDAFEISELPSENGLDWVMMTPKLGDADFTGVRLGFSADGLQRMRLRDSFDQTTLIVFDELQALAEADPALFRFVPPPGTEIVGEGQ